MGPRLFAGARITDTPSPRNIERIDCASLGMVIRMQATGCTVDRDALSDLSRYLTAECRKIEGEIEGMIGHPVNPGSHPQVRELLFKELQLHKVYMQQQIAEELVVSGKAQELLSGEPAPTERKRELRLKITPSGLVSTGKNEIERFIGAHPVVAKILYHREIDKLRGTYADSLLRKARRQADGTYRIFYTIKPCATDTGRFAGEDPNPMNIPGRTELGRRIKACWIASPGMRLFEVDFSQIEMRVAAHEAQCSRMMEVFFRNQDLHAQTAMRVYGLPEDEIHEMQHRYPMKRTGFGVLYLITGKGLAYQLNSSYSQDPDNPRFWSDEAGDVLIDDWYGVYPEIRDRQEEFFARMRRYGMSWTMFGRIRLAPEVQSVHPYVREKGLRQGANQPVQGGAADIFRLALGMLDSAYSDLRSEGVRVEGLIPVHDAIVGEADEGIADEVARLTKETMENVCELRVPIRADAKVGERWGTLAKLK